MLSVAVTKSRPSIVLRLGSRCPKRVGSVERLASLCDERLLKGCVILNDQGVKKEREPTALLDAAAADEELKRHLDSAVHH